MICPFRTDPLGLFAHNPHTSWQFDCPMVAVQFTDGFVSDDGCDGIDVVLVSVWRLCLFFLAFTGDWPAHAMRRLGQFLS